MGNQPCHLFYNIYFIILGLRPASFESFEALARQQTNNTYATSITPLGPGAGAGASGAQAEAQGGAKLAQAQAQAQAQAEQSWRLQPQDRVVSASFAPPAPAPELAPAPALPRLAPPPALRLRLRLRLGPRELSMLHRCYWFVALPKLQSFQSFEILNAILNLKNSISEQ